MQRSAVLFAYLGGLGIGGGTACAETIALIGTGNVGAVLGVRFAEVGEQVVYGSRNPSSEEVRALVERTGPLRHARIVEGLHFLRYNAVGGPLNFYFRPQPAQ